MWSSTNTVLPRSPRAGSDESCQDDQGLRADDGVQPRAVDDVGALGGIEESEHGEAEVSQPNQTSRANSRRPRATLACPRKWGPTPKTSLPATIVKNEKTRCGIEEVRPRGAAEPYEPQNREQQRPGIGDGIDGKDRIGQFAMAFEKQGVRDDPRGHHQGEAPRIERRDLMAGARARLWQARRHCRPRGLL